jgi:hypothetical protein
MTQCGQLTHEPNERLILIGEGPINPADFVVLAVRVVVSLLGACELVSRE